MRPAVAVAVLVASLALVAAGCGGDDESSDTSAAVTWAEEFCGAVKSWTDELRRIGDDITDPSSLSLDAIRRAADDVGSATETFLDDVRGLGAPDTDSGEDVRNAVESLADTIESEKREIQEALEGVSGITGIASAVRSIASALSAMSSAFQETFERIENLDTRGELERAFEQADACDEITG